MRNRFAGGPGRLGSSSEWQYAASMRWSGILLAPLALSATACSSWFRAGPQVRMVEQRAVVEGKATISGGIEQITFPLTLSAGAHPDNGQSIVALETGGDYMQVDSDSGWGYVAGPRLGFLVSGLTGSYLGMNGGPAFAFESALSDDATTLTLELFAGGGLGGDVRGGFIGGASLCLGAYREGRFTVPHGRVLWSNGCASFAAVVTGDAWCEAREVDGRGASPERLQALGEHWLKAGFDEHASVAAFARLTLELLTLGAPLELVEAAGRAAMDEIQHARSCFGLAAAYLGYAQGPGVLPSVERSAPVSLSTLAKEAVLDGCFGEGVAAELAALRAAVETDPVVHTVLHMIAGDETRHAELGWATLRWCLERGGDAVRHAAFEAFAECQELVLAAEDDVFVSDARRNLQARLAPRLKALLVGAPARSLARAA